MINITAYNKEELADKQAFFCNDNFMQTLFWATLKEEYGFKPYYFGIEYNGKTEGLILLLRPIVMGFSLAYVPHGPSKEFLLNNSLNELSKGLKKYLPNKAIFIRYDLLLPLEYESSEIIKGLKKSSVDVQVPDTTILNIEPELDILLAGMHKKTRYNIKLAGKKGVEISDVPITELDLWYNMYEVTAKRDAIAIHSKAYYKSVFDKAKSSDGIDIKLLFATHEGELLAGIFVLICGTKATYLYGASSNNKRNLMPAYLLQWEAIKLSKEVGAKSYDFFGIPHSNDKNDPMHGLYRFKIGFGGEVINRLGCYDYSLSFLSFKFRLLEKLRNFYYKKIKKS